MLGKHRLTFSIPSAHLSIDLISGRELVWAFTPIVLLALTLLTLVLSQAQAARPVPDDGIDIIQSVTADKTLSNVDWQQSNDSYLLVPSKLR